MNDIGNETAEAGLTPDILEPILNETAALDKNGAKLRNTSSITLKITGREIK